MRGGLQMVALQHGSSHLQLVGRQLVRRLAALKSDQLQARVGLFLLLPRFAVEAPARRSLRIPR